MGALIALLSQTFKTWELTVADLRGLSGVRPPPVVEAMHDE